jgi:hypothetical protein
MIDVSEICVRPWRCSEIPAAKTTAGDISVSQSARACPLTEAICILSGEAALGHADNWADVGRASARCKQEGDSAQKWTTATLEQKQG